MRLRRSRLKTIVVLIGATANCGIRVNVDFRFTNPEWTCGRASKVSETDSVSLRKSLRWKNKIQILQTCQIVILSVLEHPIIMD